MVTSTRSNYKRGNYIVCRALRHNLVPNFIKGIPLKDQTKETQWALHVLAVMSKHGDPNISEVKGVIDQTIDLLK